MRSCVLGVVLGIAGAASIGLLLQQRRSHDRVIAELRREIAGVAEAQSQQLRFVPVPVVLPAQNREPGTAPPASVVVAKEKESQAAAPSEPAKTPEVQMAERRQRYEQELMSQQSDPDWSEQARRLAGEKLQALLPAGSSIGSIECRSSLCRVETSHKDEDGYWAFLKAAFMLPDMDPWHGATYSAPIGDSPESGRMVTYLARKGHDLPPLTE